MLYVVSSFDMLLKMLLVSTDEPWIFALIPCSHNASRIREIFHPLNQNLRKQKEIMMKYVRDTFLYRC